MGMQCHRKPVRVDNEAGIGSRFDLGTFLPLLNLPQARVAGTEITLLSQRTNAYLFIVLRKGSHSGEKRASFREARQCQGVAGEHWNRSEVGLVAGFDRTGAPLRRRTLPELLQRMW